MNPARVDFVVDLAYGVSIFVAIGLILVAGTTVGVAFGLGTLVAYVSQQIEETVGEDVDEMVEKLDEIEERTADD